MTWTYGFKAVIKLCPVYLSLVLLGACGIGTARATVVYDTFGPGFTYNTLGGWTICAGSPVYVDYDQGDAFTPSQSGYVTDVWAALGFVVGDNTMELRLMDDAGCIPGNVLETWTFTNEMRDFGYNNPPLHAVGSGTTYIDSAHQYWLIASTPGPNTWAAWNENSVGILGQHAIRTAMGGWSVSSDSTGAFAIAVPEPATLALLALSGLLIARRRPGLTDLSKTYPGPSSARMAALFVSRGPSPLGNRH